MKKIVVFFHDSEINSGATHSMLDLIDFWVNKKQMKVLCVFPYRGTAASYLEKKRVKIIYRLKTTERINLERNFLYRIVVSSFKLVQVLFSYLEAKTRLSSLIRKEEVDLIYCNTTSSCVGYWVGKRIKKPIAWHMREYGNIDQHCKYLLGNRYLYSCIRKSDYRIAISKSIRAFYIKEIGECSIKVFYNDVSDYYHLPAHSIFDNTNTIFLSCGSIIEEKGHKTVIDAIIKLHDTNHEIELWILGKKEGNYYKYLKSYVENNNANKYVKFLGYIADTNSIRKNVDVAVVASYNEAFGRVIIEGMLSGALVIGANSGGTNELIIDGENGYKFQVGEYNSLVEKIEFVICNKKNAIEVARNGRSFALSFTKGRCATQIKKYVE